MTPPPREPLPRGAIPALSLAAFGSGISLRVNDALLPRLASDFAIPLADAAQVISLFAIAYGVAQFVFGPVGDRFGKYRVIAFACMACALGAAACALAPGFSALRLARIAAGAAAAAVIPLAMAWIGDVVPYDQRQPVLARFLIGQILGLAAGVALGGFAADRLSWRAPYVALAILFAGVAALLLQVQRGLPARALVRREGEGHLLARALAEFREVLSLPWARVVLATVFLEGLSLYGPFAFFATHLHQRFGVSLSTAGSVVMLFGVGGFLFALAARRLVKGLGEVGLARGGTVMMAGSLLLVGFGPGWVWSVPGCLGAGLGFYMLHNTLQVNATQMAPERRGTAVSAFASCFFLGQSAGVSIAAAVVARRGTTTVMWLGAAGLLVVGFAFAALRRRRPAVGSAAFR